MNILLKENYIYKYKQIKLIIVLKIIGRSKHSKWKCLITELWSGRYY